MAATHIVLQMLGQNKDQIHEALGNSPPKEATNRRHQPHAGPATNSARPNSRGEFLHMSMSVYICLSYQLICQLMKQLLAAPAVCSGRWPVTFQQTVLLSFVHTQCVSVCLLHGLQRSVRRSWGTCHMLVDALIIKQ